MNHKFLFALFSISVLPRCIWSIDNETALAANCDVKVISRDEVKYERINCDNVGIDGRSLDDVLLQSEYNTTFTELAPRITGLYLSQPKGDITVTGAAFYALSKLGTFGVEYGGRKKNRLILPRDGFKNKPDLTYISTHGLIFSESTVEAFGDLKHQLISFSIKGCSPAMKILKEIANFTNLTLRLEFGGCEGEEFPEDTFHKSASTIESFQISGCYMEKITKNVFNGMTNLSNLYWTHSNITTIEPGAFDDLVNLELLQMNRNKIKTLPVGLFDNNKKLRSLDFENNGVENLSRDNFTHCANFLYLEI